MTVFLMIAFLFFMGSTLGWCLEVVYRRFSPANKERRWINPGFMIGPYLPLYGFGLVALYLLASIENTALISEVTVGSKTVLFIIMAIVMTAMEYLAGLIFIKGMKVKLWDYSKEKFNLQGIICLRFSIYWAILGAVYYFLIHPHINHAILWFSQNIAFSFVVGMFYGVMLVDFIYSMGIVSKIRKFAVENQIMIKYEELKLQIRTNAAERMEKNHWFFQFRSEVPFREHLKQYIELNKVFRDRDE
ncbi:MAG: putative ABC transporter permease [Anaerovoracaceae bacterium]|nr:putative ABC transporter permease [Bacillota bacterium]MEE0517179.1 putative ABC transporter permease [Anaerovoracaceae bacterium]